MEEKRRKKRTRMSEEKKNIIASLIQEYDIQSTDDLLGDTIQEMMS